MAVWQGDFSELLVVTPPPGATMMQLWVTIGMEEDFDTGRQHPLTCEALCYVSLKAAAKENGLAPTTVAHWVRRGRLPVVAIAEFLTGARGWMVRRIDLDAVIRERKPEVWQEMTKDFVYVSQ